MASERLAGVLLHPTSLPGSPGGGDLDLTVLEPFLDWVATAGFRLWQILPLGPPAAGDSPYSCFSAFAGNPWLVSPTGLVADGLLDPADLGDGPPAGDRVDFVAGPAWRETLLRLAWRRFASRASSALAQEFVAFTYAQRGWLDDWALFAVLRRRHAGLPWWEWESDLARRRPGGLARVRGALAEELDFERFVQHCFERQWRAARAAARVRGIRILGDLPIYVALDSAEVWAAPELFDLDRNLHPRSVAGVPPDYFSADGQLWGNPLYRWDVLRDRGFTWWVDRMRRNLAQADLVRLDHFRGFAGFWSVPAKAKTAREGSWQPGPGVALFEALEATLGSLPVIAEDLGEITPDVHELRRAVGLPCMRVLQFGFDPIDCDHAPHRIPEDAALYTGTHDNNTTVGWWQSQGDELRERYRLYTGCSGEAIHHELLRLALTSPARFAIAPMQDLLGLGSAARMNTPGIAEGNWAWRLRELPHQDRAATIRSLVEVSGRLAQHPPGV